MNILKSFGIVFFLNILEYLISPFSTMVITKALSVSDYGSYSLLISMSGLIFSFFTLGLSQYNCKIVPGRDIDEQYDILGQSILYELLSALIGVSILCFVFNQKLNNTYLLMFFAIKTLLSIIINEIIRFFGYQKKNVTKSVISFLDSRGWFFIILILAFLKKITITNILLIQLINSLIVLLTISFFIDKKNFFCHLRINKTFATNVLKISISFVFIDVGMYLLEMASRYILTIQASMESVGLFSFAYSWISILFKFSMLVVYLLQPYFSEAFYKSKESQDYFERYKKYTKIAFKYSVLLIICAISLLFFYYEQIVSIIGKTDYFITYNAFKALMLLPLFMLLAYFFQIILLLAGKEKLFPICYLIMGIFNIVLNIIFIKWLDYVGAAIVCTICYAILSGLFYIFCPKEYINHLVTVKEVFLFLGITILFCLSCCLFRKIIEIKILSMLLSFLFESFIISLIVFTNKNELKFLREAK